MKLSEYAEQINLLAQLHPDLLVVFSIDDEGNEFKPLHHSPSLGNYDSEEQEWLDEQDFADYGDEYSVNAVCIN